jgi:hypothetical protein
MVRNSILGLIAIKIRAETIGFQKKCVNLPCPYRDNSVIEQSLKSYPT